MHAVMLPTVSDKVPPGLKEVLAGISLLLRRGSIHAGLFRGIFSPLEIDVHRVYARRRRYGRPRSVLLWRRIL
jgi:hypothetical protein